MMTASIKNLLGLLLLIAFTQNDLTAQCETWNGKDNMDEITDWHAVYRDLVKAKDFDSAEEYWIKVYEAAPAADGKRDFHFTDGAKIYAHKYTSTTEDSKKKEYADKAIELYNEAIACYVAGSITTKKAKNAALSGLYAKMGYDMYYTLRTPYDQVLTTYEKALELGGEETSYAVVTPMAAVAVYQYQKGKIDKDKAAQVYDALKDLCSDKAGHKYEAYYKQAFGAMKGEYNKVEKEVFDCSYFVVELKEKYGEDVNTIAYDELKVLIVTLKRQGCEAGEPYLDELESSYARQAGVINAQRKAEFEANNPGMMAKKLYDGGDFQGAIDKYKDAMASETDMKQKSSYQFSIASILFRKLKKYGEARREALKAAEMRPGWGRPYVLLGDMYSTTARNCGDPWNQSMAVLAALEKWRYSKSKELDDATATQVNKKISTYQRSKPAKEDGFMQGIKPGSKQKVGCWIGETVTVSYK